MDLLTVSIVKDVRFYGMNNNLTCGKRSVSERRSQQAGTQTALIRRILQTDHLLGGSVDVS